VPLDVCEGAWRLDCHDHVDWGDSYVEVAAIYLTKSRGAPRWRLHRDMPLADCLARLGDMRPWAGPAITCAMSDMLLAPDADFMELRSAGQRTRRRLLATLRPPTPAAVKAIHAAAARFRLGAM
jgi:hypothetical protein